MNLVLTGDSVEMLKTLESESVQCCVTSPPYWGLRDYGVPGQIGLEKTPEEYVGKLVDVFREVRRVLKKDGVLWLNLGDSYAGSMKGEGGTYKLSAKQNSNRGSHYGKDNGERHKFNHGLKPKDLVGIPWMVAFALRADRWYLRSDIIWSKPNPMPESVTDRPTKAHEYIFLLTKSARYYYDADAVAEPISESYANDKRPHGVLRQRFYENSKYVKAGMIQAGVGNFPTEERVTMRNGRSVWHIQTQPYPGAHFATFPEAIPERCIKAGSKKGDTILDPFGGSGTTGRVAKRLGRQYILIELNPKYSSELITPSLEAIDPLFAEGDDKR